MAKLAVVLKGILRKGGKKSKKDKCETTDNKYIVSEIDPFKYGWDRPPK